MHSNLWKFCEQLRSIGAKISLLSTGLALKANATEIIAHCDDVIVSLDGGPEIHNRVRNIPNAYEKLADGVQALKTINPSFRVTGRCVLQKMNFKDFFTIVRSAKELGLHQISFLAADISSTAFNRPQEWAVEKKEEVGLSTTDAEELKLILEKSFITLAAEYKQRFISESPNKMLEILQHYRAHLGQGEFAKKKCNAPWVSAVVESTGDVLPCFFHKPYGNIYKKSFLEIINSENAIAFRKELNIQKDPICQRCVCSVYIEPWQKV